MLETGRLCHRRISFVSRPFPLATSCSQFLDVENVLLSSTCEFVLDEVIFGYDDGSDFALDKSLDSIFPGLIETDTVDVLQNVHPGRRLADLEHGAVHKVCRTEILERSSVLSKCAKQRLAVCFVRPNEDIQVLGRSRLGMYPERIPSHDQVLNGVIVEGA
jgi:hypothetical protein